MKYLILNIAFAIICSGCVGNPNASSAHIIDAKWSNMQLEFLVVERENVVRSVFVRGRLIVPLTIGGVFTEDWTSELIRSYEYEFSQGEKRWERTKLNGNDLKFTVGTIDSIPRMVTGVIERGKTGSFTLKLSEETEDVKIPEVKPLENPVDPFAPI